jgi:hypothetical protein
MRVGANGGLMRAVLPFGPMKATATAPIERLCRTKILPDVVCNATRELSLLQLQYAPAIAMLQMCSATPVSSRLPLPKLASKLMNLPTIL